MDDYLQTLRPTFATYDKPVDEEDPELQNPAVKACRSLFTMREVVPYFNCVEGITALCYAHSGFTQTILACIDPRSFYLRVCYLFVNNCNTTNVESNWHRRIYMHNGVKTYREQIVHMPAEVLLNVPNIMIDSHYSRMTADMTDFDYIPSKTLPGKMWYPIVSCSFAKKINIISVNIEEDFLKRWFPQMKWKWLNEIRLENVQCNVNSAELRTVTYSFIQSLYVPPLLIKALFASNTVESLELISLYLNKEGIVAMEESSGYEKVTKLHIEDIIVEPDCKFKMDHVVLAMLQNTGFQSLTLALNGDFYGWTLIETVLLMRIKIPRVELILNMNEASVMMFCMVTRLHELCDEIYLTFHRTYKAVRLPRIDESMRTEMRSWTKVFGVTLGKTLAPYSFTNAPIANTESYVLYLSCLPNIPNLRKFGLADRVNRHVLVATAMYLRSNDFEEITLAISEKLENNEYGMKWYYRLLDAIRPAIRSLSLIYLPMDDTCVEILSRHSENLRDLKYYQLLDMKKTRKEIDEALPKTKKSMKSWLSATPCLHKFNTVSNYIINVRLNGEN